MHLPKGNPDRKAAEDLLRELRNVWSEGAA